MTGACDHFEVIACCVHQVSDGFLLAICCSGVRRLVNESTIFDVVSCLVCLLLERTYEVNFDVVMVSAVVGIVCVETPWN